MNVLQAIILGIIQGLTEFLPISSSAHLVIAPFILSWQINPEIAFTFNVLVQNGTLIAVVIYFWNDLWSIIKSFAQGLVSGKPFSHPNARLGWLLILATIPAGVFGLLVKPYVEMAFGSVAATAGFLFLTAALLLIAELLGKRQRDYSEITWRDALVMGLFQALAIFPGISRSGSTITGGMLRHLDRRTSARFSFLMSIPIMLAAGIFESLDAIRYPLLLNSLPLILIGFVSAAVVGYISIHWLLGFLQKRSLASFAIYCFILGVITIVLGFIR